jgi:hypothetical protein
MSLTSAAVNFAFAEIVQQHIDASRYAGGCKREAAVSSVGLPAFLKILPKMILTNI